MSDSTLLLPRPQWAGSSRCQSSVTLVESCFICYLISWCNKFWGRVFNCPWQLALCCPVRQVSSISTLQMRTESLICHSCSENQGWDRGILDLFHSSRVSLIMQCCWKLCFSAPWLTQTILLLLWAEAWSRNLELACCITAHVEAKIISNGYILLCRDWGNAHVHPQCLKVRLEW